MALDQSYLDAIKGFEGYSPNPSWDYKQYSSGYGTKAQAGDEAIPPDQRKAVYEQRFADEIGKASQSVDSFAPNLPPGVRAALTSLTYNAGPSWQQQGLGAAVKAGNWDAARNLFLQYNKAGGELNPGLVARRQKEASWFGGQPQTASASPASPSSGLPIPQQQPPILAPQAVPQMAAAPSAAPQNIFAQMPAPQVPAPQFTPIPRIDFSQLRAALAQQPGLFNGLA